MNREFDAQDIAEIALRPGGLRVLTAQRHAMSQAIAGIDQLHADHCAEYNDKRQRLVGLLAMLDSAIDSAVPGQLKA